MLNSCSITTSIHRDPLIVDTSQQILDSSSIDKTHVFLSSIPLNTSWSVENYVFLYIGSARFSLISPWSISIENHFSLPQTFLNQPLHLPYSFFGLFIAFFTSMISFLAFNHTFHAFWPRFWDFLKTFGVFRNWWSFGEIFGLGCVYRVN